MKNNFENFSWDYDPKKDPYHKRSFSSEKRRWVRTEKNMGGSDIETDFAVVIFFEQLEEALVGIVELAAGPPIACYSSSITRTLLQEEHGLSKAHAKFALTKLIATDLGPNAPCFLDTSIIEK